MPRPLRDLALMVVLALALASICLRVANAGRDRATIAPAFEAACVQGAVCAAPAVVHLDASATTAEGVERPFHELRYAWDCGDGGEPPVAQPIASCTYDRPGRYAVVLRVDRGDESALAAREVVVLDRSAVRVVELAAGSRQATVALGAGPGLLTTRGGGPRAVLTGPLSPPDGWTVAGVDLEGGCVSLAPERSRVTLIDVRATGCRSGALVMQTGGGVRHSDLIAVARSTLRNAPGVAVPAAFLRASRIVVTDSDLSADYYPLRTVHFPGLVLARSRLSTSAAGHNAAQLRAWAGAGPPQAPSERWVVAESTFEAATPSTAILRTCRSNTCGTGGPEVRDGILSDNVLRVTGAAAPPPALGFWLEGSDITVRGNTIEAPGVSMAGPGATRLVAQFGQGGDRLQVVGNRAHAPDQLSDERGHADGAARSLGSQAIDLCRREVERDRRAAAGGVAGRARHLGSRLVPRVADDLDQLVERGPRIARQRLSDDDAQIVGAVVSDLGRQRRDHLARAALDALAPMRAVLHGSEHAVVADRAVILAEIDGLGEVGEAVVDDGLHGVSPVSGLSTREIVYSYYRPRKRKSETRCDFS